MVCLSIFTTLPVTNFESSVEFLDTCIEKDIEIIPLQKIVTVLSEDTFGISRILGDYRVETTFQTLSHRSTKVEISHYYSTTTLKAKLLNLIATSPVRPRQH